MHEKIGFTGTQRGMTDSQKQDLTALLTRYRPSEFHHGDCIGADAQAHAIAISLGIRVIIHPPRYASKRANCTGAAETRPPDEYLIRNSHIVAETDRLFATPGERAEQLRSGTWATVRCARRTQKPVHLILPL